MTMMEKYSPKLFIFVGVLAAAVGFVLLDTDELSSRASILEILGAPLIVLRLPYRFVLLFSVAVVGVGAYRSWIRKGEGAER